MVKHNDDVCFGECEFEEEIFSSKYFSCSTMDYHWERRKFKSLYSLPPKLLGVEITFVFIDVWGNLFINEESRISLERDGGTYLLSMVEER